ncbi:fatty acid biosynthesis protein FabY [Providencia alcalifaciens]|uniref:N-acetyltransferase domain-containing protein n=1 Tax=Providencia alcalifaciens DSM 30120 TaxID=520999 RepID=B6XH32_9GAMM|nr:fatty acid biosynthesis protein FabY [Providencia alcalifaciens]ATG15391.1 GNAT family N-acetyltransferase [Providencia alcalifaciens]EEB45225.1 hypothetical protein PROVALCAL_02670 [Providencia alcalifaciens DSM 30120]MTC52301.1 fatty acid biosynthesis protein FabY [Providencia alcalifaciens]SQI31044.1 acetyltransferase [Providencia alcalifaciens]
MYHLRTPKDELEFAAYYQFRWSMLREPFKQPLGSEKDGYDLTAHHQMVVDEKNRILAIGRLYINADNEGAIRFLAVNPVMQGKGLGKLIIMALETIARREGVKRIVSSVREEAVPFFAKMGFESRGEAIGELKTPVRHYLMIKPIETLDQILHRPDWCGELQQAWHKYIPLSEKMGVRIEQYTGKRFVTTMPEAGNQNPHNTIFAGSQFSLATLTGWGMIWLLLQENKLGGEIVLVDANIRYAKPVSGRPTAVADLSHLSGDLDRLARGSKARVKLEVHVTNAENQVGAVFSGVYMVLPESKTDKNA